jgi:hypothetical protein
MGNTTLQPLDRVVYLFEDSECLKISQVRVLDVTAFGSIEVVL